MYAIRSYYGSGAMNKGEPIAVVTVAPRLPSCTMVAIPPGVAGYAVRGASE